MINSTEELSSIYDGEQLPQGKLALNAQQLKHLKNYSMIGAALRHELSSELDRDLVAEVAVAVAKEPLPQVDQTHLDKTEIRFSYKKFFSKLGFVFAQTAVAASIAMLTIVGYQTYNAQNIVPGDNGASLGISGNVNLASYQNTNNVAISFDNVQPVENHNLNQRNIESASLKQQQDYESERINNYLRGYVLDAQVAR